MPATATTNASIYTVYNIGASCKRRRKYLQFIDTLLMCKFFNSQLQRYTNGWIEENTQNKLTYFQQL